MPSELRKPSYTFPTFAPPEAVEDEEWLWIQIKAEAHRDAKTEPILASFLTATVLSHKSLHRSLSYLLANKLGTATLPSTLLYDLFVDTFTTHPVIRDAVVADLIATRERDPACTSYSHCLLNYKGFLALQAHRISHVLWQQHRRPLARTLQSMIADTFAVDIHPAATVGKAVLLDHATGIVIGETTVIGDKVSILHHVTLGGTGKEVGDRHPKIGNGVLIGAGAAIIGNLRIGEGAKVGAGAVVIRDVDPWTTVAGNVAEVKRRNEQGGMEQEQAPGVSMDQTFPFIYEI